MSAPSGRPGGVGAPAGIGRRLLLAQALVLAASLLTAGAVATLVGPPIFHRHLIETGHPSDSPEREHIELAYRDASSLSLGAAALVALLCALAATWWLNRRFQRPLQALTTAARELGRGHYGTRVDRFPDSAEFDTLADTFNGMAERIDHVEDTRRRLLTDLAHEMRTPVATLAAYLDGLEDGVAQWDEHTSRVLRNQTERLTRLAGDIDNVSRAEEGRVALDRRWLAPDALLDDAVAAFVDSYERKGVGLHRVASTGKLPDVLADRDRAGQVLSNLLSNALRHTPPGGTVTVSAAGGRDEVTITVRDTGEGIAEKDLPRVFERFYRGSGDRPQRDAGTGVGLTISKALIDAHGGAITAASGGPGRGATFRVLLPADRRGGKGPVRDG